MLLSEEIIIYPPPFTNHSNKIIQPDPIKFKYLNVSYIDNPTNKTVFAQIKNIPQPILLVGGDEYVTLGDYTHQQIENILKSKLGDDIQLKLRSLFPKTLEENPNGPGTILAGMFSSLGIKSSPTCSCRQHAIEMNEKGNDWCEANMDTIVAWLKQESEKRKIPFIESLAKIIIKKAIHKSRILLKQNKE
jgi:hypothetical protein